MSRACSKCLEVKADAEFSRDRRRVSGLRAECKKCSSAAHSAWRSSNVEKCRQNIKKWRANNQERAKELSRDGMRRAYLATPDRYRRIAVRWAAENKESRAEQQSKRRAKGICAWANKEKIKEIYAFAKEFRGACFDVEVDHIEPLQGETVCGLHVEHNLRVCLASANRSKRNKQQEFFQ